MSEPVLAIGDKLHIVTRRLFEGDARRNFVGEVTRISGDLQEVQGYAFVFQSMTNEYKKRLELRTRVFALGDSGLVVIKLPREVVLADVEYRYVERRLVVTDGRGFVLDIDEFGHSR